MLDATTKRKIDSARQILVGKVPDPKQQVDQITTALIYKFMDDMDKESQELGGKAKFFTNTFKEYSWTKLLDKRFSGQERLDLYVQAITNLSKNPHIPQLFRDIFKDAFLPYRDPETLSLFLKEIDGFTYDHSENLGNAFEYLLSILGSQGDAGQFRTPRHIIDFIVEVVDPKKNENVLDPACGTAGFLISAYKHIRKYNSSNFKPEKEKIEDKIKEGKTATEAVLQEKVTYHGDLLTPIEKSKLMRNFVGYDISPDMVKLSLVNMYLHGFSSPKIYEYDTLTSEKHWGELYDVIMANPPFMTPKGGIRPHKRFSVQAKRSEVLFVDYILEHLNLHGRAGIIVPEGIIFKTENAYKRLRQMLIEDGLYAVVSLPSGVFNPYSGVKTSILFFDNLHAKKTDEILFLKVKNDGFDLGAKRRKIKKTDLPEALEILETWKQGKKNEGDIALWARKEKIAENGDYNLSGERYREVETRKKQNWPFVELGKIITLEYGKPLKKEDRKGGDYPVYGSNGVVGYHNKYLVKGPFIIVGRKGTAGAVTYSDKSGFPIDTTFYVQLREKFEVDLKFLYLIMQTLNLGKINKQSGVPGLNRNDAYRVKIPLPSLDVQKEIVEQIEVKQNAINAAHDVIKNLEREGRYFGRELSKLKDVEWVELGMVCEITSSKRVFESEWKSEGVPFYRAREIVKLANDGFVDNELFISQNMYSEYSAEFGFPNEGDLMVTGVGTLGICYQVKKDDRFYFKDGNIIWLRNFDSRVSSVFVKYLFNGDIVKNQIRSFSSGGTVGTYTITNAKKTKIPLPSLDIQKKLIEEAEKEEEIVDANRCMIELMEKKIDKILEDI